MKLLTIPFAGGSANYYNRWKQLIDDDIDIISIELKGRGSRIAEPLYEDINEVVLDVFDHINKEITNYPYAMFGHSMGALICFELTCLIKKMKLPMPKHLFLSGMNAPGTDKIRREIHLLEGKDFQNEILAIGGTSKEIFKYPQLLNFYMPIIKNDLRIAYNYIYTKKESVLLDCAFTIFTGKDERYTKEQLKTWNEYTTRSCEFYKFNGGHFFINEETENIISIINQTLKNNLF